MAQKSDKGVTTKLLARIKSYFKNDPLIIIIAIFFVIFSVYWANISILKFYALHATLFDLGLAMQNAWAFMYHPLQFYPNLILWVVFPVFIPQSFPLILAFQATFITAGIFPVYGIAKHFLKLKSAAMLIAISYLLYPYLSGMYWFDFHYQALFPTLFLIGYYLFIKTRYKSAFILLILAGITRYPYIFFIILLSFLIMLETLYDMRYKKPEFNIKTLRFAAVLFFASFIIFILSYIASSGTASISQSMTGNAHFMGGTFFYGIDFKLFVLYILFIPLFGLPLFSRRFVLMLAPFIFVLFSANYWAYMFPAFVHLQYGPLIVPFLYLGTIDAIARIFEHHENHDTKRFNRFKSIVTAPRFKVAAAILVLMVLFAMVYQPYGPLNEYSMTNFDVAENTAVNWTTFNNLEHIVSIIPRSDPYVLTQNNIPEIYPRALLPESYYGSYYNSVMDLQFMNFLNNITASNHYMNTSTGLVNARIDYVLADMNSPQYLSTTPSMYDFTSVLYGSGQYGIVGEASGFVLLKQHYAGPIQYYRPMSYNFNYTQISPGNISKIWHSTILSNSTLNGTMWTTPVMNLAPGAYNVTVQVRSNSSTSMTLKATAFGVPMITEHTVNVSGGWTNVTIQFYLYNFYTDVQITGYSLHASIMTKNVIVTETKPFSEFGQFFSVTNVMVSELVRYPS
ncbi:MAG: DUF2079 domain-containing protein [Thermoplasmata archaeon]